MPSSKRRRMTSQRCRYTRERHAEAAPGVGRDRSHGLDSCTLVQRRFRALLAVFTLNERTESRACHLLSQHWSPGQVLQRTHYLSARLDEFVIFSDIPHHLIHKLVPSPSRPDLYGVPGLRCYDHDPEGQWFRLRHLPTGGLLRLQYTGPTGAERAYRYLPEGEGRPQGWEASAPDRALTEAETIALKVVPAMTEDAEALLAGLLVRLSCEDPDGHWAIGELEFDPLQRGLPGALPNRRYLWGSDDRWVFHYNGPIPAEDVAAALTDPVIGIAGANIVGGGEGIRVRRGAATLDITNYTEPYDRFDYGRGPRLYWNRAQMAYAASRLGA